MQGSRSATVGWEVFLASGRSSSCGLRRRRGGGTADPRWRRGPLARRSRERAAARVWRLWWRRWRGGVRRRAGDPSYRAAAALACAPGVGKSRWEKWRDERGRCARKGAKLTRGPGSVARVSSASRGGTRARAERGLQACLARAERRDAAEVGRGYLGCAEEVGTGERATRR